MAVIDIEYGQQVLSEYSGEVQVQQTQPLQWEMVLQNSSIGHEYARLELDQASDIMTRENLIDKMDNYKRAYFLARRYMKRHNPLRLETIEADLIDQKSVLFNGYQA